jgi:hypothetical protein
VSEQMDAEAMPVEVVDLQWKFDDAAKARAAAELALIDEAQSGKPTCTLCGQRVNQLDTFGLCSKISENHRHVREQGGAA